MLGGPLAWTFGNILGNYLLGAPQLSDPVKRAFQRDMSYVATLARIRQHFFPDDAELASGQVPSLAGIGPNSTYARGGPGVPPASYSDPLLPWGLTDPDPLTQQRKQALHLTFADAHTADRCAELTVADLEAYVAAAGAALESGDPEREVAACGPCVQMLAPHLRFGVEGNHDLRREAFCTFAAVPPVAPAFVYTEEDPADFTGVEPSDLASLREATRDRCGCGELRFFVGSIVVRRDIDRITGCALCTERGFRQASWTVRLAPRPDGSLAASGRLTFIVREESRNVTEEGETCTSTNTQDGDGPVLSYGGTLTDPVGTLEGSALLTKVFEDSPCQGEPGEVDVDVEVEGFSVDASAVTPVFDAGELVALVWESTSDDGAGSVDTVRGRADLVR